MRFRVPALGFIIPAVLSGQTDLLRRIPLMTDTEIVQMANGIVDDGAPPGEQVTVLTVLARARSSVVLPLLGSKIEEVLRSDKPASCFKGNSVNPEQAVERLLYTIAGLGNADGLRQASRLLKLDQKRFDRVVSQIMDSAMAGDREFSVAYQGFDLEDEAVNNRLGAWANKALAQELPLVGIPGYDSVWGMRRKWAEALVQRYGAVPTAQQWDTDPLVSRLRPEIWAKLYYDLHRFAVDEVLKRAKREH